MSLSYQTISLTNKNVNLMVVEGKRFQGVQRLHSLKKINICTTINDSKQISVEMVQFGQSGDGQNDHQTGLSHAINVF